MAKGYKRKNTKPQNDRVISIAQSGFLGGMNLDIPSSEIDGTELANLENLIPFRTHLECRSGVTKIGVTAPGSGTYNNLKYIPKSNTVVLHRGTGLHVSTDSMATWSTVSGDNVTVVDETGGSITTLGEDIVIHQSTQILLIETGNSNYLRQLNEDNPTELLDVSTSLASGSFTYRFTYTYARLIGTDIVAESGTVSPDGGSTFYTELSTSMSLTDASQISIDSFTIPSGTDYTHIIVYRTLDIGDAGINAGNGLDHYFRTKTLTFTQANAFSTQVGIGSVIVGSTYIVGGEVNNLAAADETLFKLSTSLRTLDFKPLPSGKIGHSSQTYLNSATDNGKIMYYSYTGDEDISGYYNEGEQFRKFEDGIRAMVSSPDSFTICCNSTTYRQSVTGNELITGSPATGGLTFQLDKPTLMDENVGVIDVHSIAQMDNSRFIAHCSDDTIRVWDGTAWGTDLARFKVKKEIAQINESVGLYSPDGYYLLWYLNDNSSTVTTKTLRLGLAEDVGVGWCYFNGTGWPQVPLKMGSMRMTNTGDGLPKLVALDDSDDFFYQVETVDGYSGSGFTRSDVDKTSTDIPTKVEFKAGRGSKEFFSIYHAESHFYFRPFDRNGSFLSSFSADLAAYIDDSSNAVDTYLDFDLDGSVHFGKEVVGNRIRLEMSTTKAGYSLVEMDTIFNVQDRNLVNQTDQTEGALQLSLATDLLFWQSSVDPTLSNATGSNGTVLGTAGYNDDGVVGNGSPAYAFVGTTSVDSGLSFTLTTPTISNQKFTYSMWYRVPSPTGNKEKILYFNTNKMSIAIQTTSFITEVFLTDTASSETSVVTSVNLEPYPYSYLTIVYDATDVTFYLDKVLVATFSSITITDAKLLTIQLGEETGMVVQDARLYNKQLTTDEIAYLYNSVNDGVSEKVLEIT